MVLPCPALPCLALPCFALLCPALLHLYPTRHPTPRHRIHTVITRIRPNDTGVFILGFVQPPPFSSRPSHRRETKTGSKRQRTNERTNNTSDPQFHADNLSSAHIYLRLPSPSASSATGSTSTTTTATTATSAPPSLPGTHPEEPPTNTYSWERIPPDLLADLAQLTKANSIEGNKKDNVTVVYTPWTNLRKDGGMAVGQVGFRDERKVRHARLLFLSVRPFLFRSVYPIVVGWVD
jgi:hypothetical protein